MEKSVRACQRELALIPGLDDQDQEVISAIDEIRVVAIAAVDSFLASLGDVE